MGSMSLRKPTLSCCVEEADDDLNRTETATQKQINQKSDSLFTTPRSLETEAVNIALVKDEGGAEYHFIIFDFNLAQSPGLHLAVTALELALAQSARCVDRQITQVKRIPEHNALDHSCVNVRLAHIRQRQTGQLHVRATRLLDRLGCAGHRRSSNRHDQLDARINF